MNNIKKNMIMEYFDRYENFRRDGSFVKVPYIEIETYDTDLYIVFNKSKMRLDNLSYKYYGNPNFAWLLMLANSEYGSMEFNIPDNVTFRIPYPLDSALLRYNGKVNNL